MSIRSFENYASVAEAASASHLEVAGRYAFQATAERRILPDVLEKLSLQPEDSLLEIGCGPGNLLIPLSHFVARAAGIDNAAAIKRLSARIGDSSHICLHTGDFLSMQPLAEKFSKILVYSVVQCLDDEPMLHAFVRAALGLLQPGGRLLVGDLANRDKKRRFSTSPQGIRVSGEWARLVSAGAAHPFAEQPPDDRMLEITDDVVSGLLRLGREAGFETYLLPQAADLPFGNTREDVLFVAPQD